MLASKYSVNAHEVLSAVIRDELSKYPSEKVDQIIEDVDTAMAEFLVFGDSDDLVDVLTDATALGMYFDTLKVENVCSLIACGGK